MRWTDHVARMEECRRSFKILTGKPTGKRTAADLCSRKDTATQERRDYKIAVVLTARTNEKAKHIDAGLKNL